MNDFPHTITLEKDGPVGRMRFSSEHPANVFTLPMLREMAEHVGELERPGELRVLVVEGRADTFSGGADLQSILDMDEATYIDYIETEYRLFRAIETLPLTTVALLRGSCVGNAAEIALACDFRVAAETCRIGWPEIHVGFFAPSQRLARFVGIGQAKEILFEGKLLKAPRAKELGLLTDVVAEDELEAATDKLAADLATRAPVAVRLTKAGIERAYSFPPDNPGLEVRAAAQSYATEDLREGAAAILERRRPTFHGR
ncbi:enoyl-CoA hydratase/isomerase family protein [Amycolatopsis sp. K13G38]|uniref:Enoyl-CoA hydratase/isomerase family protein n=1 Tax=Amycolatopsis acididurans TaxID=2724524 RepID=A0ABX1J0N8_9PSEU|nr:enoyl-CoA hydratase/isomerase family protein [Amycolatopsis acididurans]NKQ53189.1 enoyl-CoA hydratase/isomerase family protein [Amycolatopsis acididurans]